MALVAYDNSDSSDLEDDDNENIHVVTLNKKVNELATSKHIAENGSEDIDSSDKGQSLFNRLPQPSTKKATVIEEDDEFLHKKETTNVVKPKAKITVPSLSDFRDVEDSTPNSRPKVSNGKKSGLLSILPQPKNGVKEKTTSLIPNILTQKPNAIKKKESMPIPQTRNKKAKLDPPKALAIDYSDESDNEEVENDFFSINKSEEPIADLPLDIDNTTEVNITQSSQKKPQTIQSYFKQDTVQNHMELQPDYVANSNDVTGYYGETTNSSNKNVIASSSNNEELALDEEAIRQLVGARGKRKKEDIQIVDVNQKEVLADAREWLLKGLMDDTSKRVSSSKKSGNEPTTQQRRKHQITYLAHQAKANEAELQNQWANNRMSKRKTQSKYGF